MLLVDGRLIAGRCRLIAARCWLLLVGGRLIAGRCRLIAARCWLLTVGRFLGVDFRLGFSGH